MNRVTQSSHCVAITTLSSEKMLKILLDCVWPATLSVRIDSGGQAWIDRGFSLNMINRHGETRIDCCWLHP